MQSTAGTSNLTVTSGTQTMDSTSTLQIAGGLLSVALSNSGQLNINGNLTQDASPEALVLGGDGSGQLVLGGASTYSGGTTVNAGLLVVQESTGLLAGSNLSVGSAADLAAFGSPMVAGPIQPVPEPGTLLLLLAALGGAAIYGRLRPRSKTPAA